MTADERDAAEDDHNDAVQDALADLGVAVREAVEARRVYERAIEAAGAAGARMEAAAANEKRALEALRIVHGAAPAFVHTPEPPSNAEEITTYSRGRRPSPRGACSLRLFDHHDRDGHWWWWWCSQHKDGDGAWRTREEAEVAFNGHRAETTEAPVACTPEITQEACGRWRWRCSVHPFAHADGFRSRASAEESASVHLRGMGSGRH